MLWAQVRSGPEPRPPEERPGEGGGRDPRPNPANLLLKDWPCAPCSADIQALERTPTPPCSGVPVQGAAER